MLGFVRRVHRAERDLRAVVEQQRRAHLRVGMTKRFSTCASSRRR